MLDNGHLQEDTSILRPVLHERHYRRRQIILIVLLVIWNILLFCLAVAGLARSKEDSGGSGSPIKDTCVKATFAQASPVTAGAVVSLNNAGQIKMGAGTTVYTQNKLVTLADAIDLVLVTIDAVTSMAIFNQGSPSALYYAFGVTQPAGINWSAVQENGAFNITSLQATVLSSTSVALVSAQGLVLISLTPGTPFPTASFSALIPYATSLAESSQIAALSPTTIGICFFDSTSNTTVPVYLRVGTVSGNSVTWVEPDLEVVPEASSTKLNALSGNQFLLSYYNNSALCAQVIAYSAGSPLQPGSFACMAPSFQNFFTSVVLSPTMAVLVFDDWIVGNAILAVALSITADGGVQFASHSAINNGGAGGLQGISWSTISIAAVSPSAFVFAYPDIANGDRVTAVVAEVSDSYQIYVVSPSFVLTSENPIPSENYRWLAVASHPFLATGANNQGSFIVISSLTNTETFIGIAAALAVHTTRPLGIALDVTDSSAVVVGMSGSCPMPAGMSLQPAYEYFSDSTGALVPVTPQTAAVSRREYIDLGNKLITASAWTGIAVTSSDMLVQYRRP